MINNKVKLEFKSKVAIVTLSRPDKKNALDEATYADLVNTTREIRDRMPRVVVITGEGSEAFSAGFDVNPANPLVKNLLNAMENQDPDSGRRVVDYIRKSLDPFFALPMPIIAAINGVAFGGGAELAVRCDLRVMDANAEICFSEVKLGLMPDMVRRFTIIDGHSVTLFEGQRRVCFYHGI